MRTILFLALIIGFSLPLFAEDNESQKWDAAVQKAKVFLTSDQPINAALFTEAKTRIEELRHVTLLLKHPSLKTKTAAAHALIQKIVVKVLLLHKLNPELYLCTVCMDNVTCFAVACIQILDELAEGKREPDWAKPALALSELEKAYRWYGPQRELQLYVSEVMMDVQKRVHDTGCTELSGDVLREAVVVIHAFQDEMRMHPPESK